MKKKGAKREKEKPEQHHKHWLLKLGAILAAAFGAWEFKKMSKEKRTKIIRGSEKQAYRFVHRLHDFFIPHERNEYKPHIFRHRAVKHIILAIIIVKVAVVSTLAVLYPNLA